MTHDGNYCEDFLQFRYSQVVKNSFCLHFSIFFFVNSSCYTFFEALTCLIRNNITKIFKNARHVEQNKEKKCLVWTSMFLYSNRSWAMTNHSTRSIHIIVYTLTDHGKPPITARVAFISLYKKLYNLLLDPD